MPRNSYDPFDDEPFDEMMFPTIPPKAPDQTPSPSKDGEVKDLPPEPP